MRTRIATILTTMLAAATSFPAHAQEQAVDLRAIAAGTWGFSVEKASCADNPHMLEFTDQGRTMTMRYTVSLDGNPPTSATYTVLSEGPDFLRMRKVNEQEKTAAGETVVWDLVLLSRDSYCWHRTDWKPEGCTAPATRCKDARPHQGR